MITAVDTSVIIDVLGGDPDFGRDSRHSLDACAAAGRLTICEVVLAEVSGFFPSRDDAMHALDALQLEFDPLGPPASLLAGANWKLYRDRGGPRIRILADFLVGSHAFVQADRLLTRDARFHRVYLPQLAIVGPASP